MCVAGYPAVPQTLRLPKDTIGVGAAVLDGGDGPVVCGCPMQPPAAVQCFVRIVHDAPVGGLSIYFRDGKALAAVQKGTPGSGPADASKDASLAVEDIEDLDAMLTLVKSTTNSSEGSSDGGSV